MLKGYENYEKLKENALRTKRAVMNCISAMDIYCVISREEKTY